MQELKGGDLAATLRFTCCTRTRNTPPRHCLCHRKIIPCAFESFWVSLLRRGRYYTQQYRNTAAAVLCDARATTYMMRESEHGESKALPTRRTMEILRNTQLQTTERHDTRPRQAT